MRRAARSILLASSLLAAAGCLLEFPDAADGPYACDRDDDCAAGYTCMEGTCTATDPTDTDGGPVDAGPPDAGLPDAGLPDGGPSDGGRPDGGEGLSLTSVEVRPELAGVGADVVVTATATAPLQSCEVTVGTQSADCAEPNGAECSCTWVVGEAGPEGELSVNLTASGASGTAERTLSLLVDRTPPTVHDAGLSMARRPIGTDDAVAVAEGALEDTGVSYEGQGIAEWRVWAYQGATVPLTVERNAWSESPLPDTDGTGPETLAPATVWLSAMDAAGNESPRVEVLAGQDRGPPSIDPQAIGFDAEASEVILFAGAVTDTTSAVRVVRLFGQSSGGTPIAEVQPAVDGSAGPIKVQGGLPGVWMDAEDKVGHGAARVRIPARTSCAGSGACNPGQVCRDGLCFPFDPAAGCTDAADCPREHVCENGTCRGCVGDGDCAASLYGPKCDLTDDNNGPGLGYCYAECGDGLPSCPQGMVCDQARGGLCVKGCNDRTDCPQGLVCLNRFKCGPCEVQDQCAAEEICDDAGRCVPRPQCRDEAIDLCQRNLGDAYFCDDLTGQCVLGCTQPNCQATDENNCNPCTQDTCVSSSHQCGVECYTGCASVGGSCAESGQVCDLVTCQCTTPGSRLVGGNGGHCAVCLFDSDCQRGYTCEGAHPTAGIPGRCFEACSAEGLCGCSAEGATCRGPDGAAIGAVGCLLGAKGVCRGDCSGLP